MSRTIAEIVEELADKIAEIKDMAEKTRDKDLVQAVKFYYHAKEAHTALDEVRKRLYHIVDEYDKAILPAKFGDSGLDLVRVPELARSFYPSDKFSARTVDKDKLFEWLRSPGVNQAEIITETVNASTLAGVLKSLMLEQGIEAPEDVAVLTKYQTIGSSKYTPKDK